MQLKSLIFFVSGIAISWGATVTDVKTDLINVSDQVTTLNNTIQSFPDSGGTLTSALAIHTDATNLQSAVSATTSDVTSVATVSESDAQAILAQVQSFSPTILDALQAIVAKKPAFGRLPVGGVSDLITKDLTGLNGTTSDLSGALVDKAPADLQSKAQALQTQIADAFATAIAAYSQ